jgi:hypothetical protein
MAHVWHRCLKLLAVLCFLGYFLVSSARLMRLPALHHDEILFTDVARGITSGRLTEKVLGVPVMVFPYIGCLKSLIYAPIFALRHVSIATVRVPAILLSGLALLVGFATLRRFLRASTAILAFGLMATDPVFIFAATLDFGPIVLMVLFKLVMIAAIARFLARPSTGRLALVATAMLLGVYDKLNFLWFVLAAAAAMLLVYHRRWWRWFVAHRSAWVIVAAFGAALAGFSWYAISCSMSVPGPATPATLFGKLVVVWKMWLSTFRANSTYLFVVGQFPPMDFPSACWLVLGSVAVLLAARIVLTSRAQPRRSRLLAGVTLALGTALAVCFLEMVITPRAIGPHHIMILWPLHQWLAVLGLVLLTRRPDTPFMRGVLATGLLAIVVLQVAVLESQLGEIERSRTFSSAWDHKSEELARFIRSRFQGADAVVFAEWGALNQVRAACPRELYNRLRDEDWEFESLDRKTPGQRAQFYQRVMAGKSLLVVLNETGHRAHPQCRKNLFALLDERECERRWIKTWCDSSGTAIYAILYVRCPAG